jgi:hypothetical protein
MSIIKMFNTVTGVTSAATSIDIPAKGIIRLITLGALFADASPVIGEGMTAELSFLSTAQYTTNDARGSLCQVAQAVSFADAARIVLSGTPFCLLAPIAIIVNAGERIFLHAVGGGASVVISASAYLFIDDGIDVARAQVRRR